jgi:uncharacterized protein (UPF0548 family)
MGPQLNLAQVGRRAAAAPIIWKDVTTAFNGRMIAGWYAVEDDIVKVQTTLGEKEAQLRGTNAALVAWRPLREMAAEGKA